MSKIESRYDHLTVNHSKTYKDPVRGRAPIPLNGTWNGFKIRMVRKCRASNLEEHLGFVIWKDRNHDNMLGGLVLRALKNTVYNSGKRALEHDSVGEGTGHLASLHE